MVALAVPAALAVATGQVFLFPSLAPTAVMVANEPKHPGSRPYSIVLAHVVGMAAGFAAVAVLGIAHAPSVFAAGHVSLARAAAALLAIGVGTAVELSLRAQHPPAASTTLLAALGSFHPTWHDAALVLGGVAAVTVSGEAVRLWRLRGAGRGS